MTIRTVRVEGDPILRKKCKKVREMTQRTASLIEDMFNTMHEAKGVGLAAPQVGVLRRICVIDCGLKESQPYVLINPEIIFSEGEQTGEEGCLSVPGYKGTVTRAQKVKVKFQNENMQETILEADGLLARCIQHETDHLDGILYIDKVEGKLREADDDSGDAKEDYDSQGDAEEESSNRGEIPGENAGKSAIKEEAPGKTRDNFQ